MCNHFCLTSAVDMIDWKNRLHSGLCGCIAPTHKYQVLTIQAGTISTRTMMGDGAGNMNAIRSSSSGKWALERLTTSLNGVHYRFPLPISPLSVQPITLS